MKKTQTRYDGYSLLEIMAVLIIMSVIAMMSLPAMQNIIRISEDKLLQTQLMRAISRARIQSRLRQVGISICPSRDFEHCGEEWREGMLIFMDDANRGEIVERTQIISAVQFHDVPGVMRWRAYPSTRHYLHITPKRWVTADNGMFLYCEKLTTKPRFAVVVNNAGVAHVKWPDEMGEMVDSRHRVLRC